MSRTVVGVVLVLVLTACDGTAATEAPAPDPSGDLGVVTPDAAREAMAALCEMEAATSRDEANTIFYDRAHHTLHVIAAATGPVDRSVEATLLVTKQRVEAALARRELPASFADDVEVLRVATSGALETIALDPPPCPGD